MDNIKEIISVKLATKQFAELTDSTLQMSKEHV